MAPADDVPQEMIIEKRHWLATDDFDAGSQRRVERGALDHRRGREIPRIEPRIHGRGQPDEPATHAFPQRETQLELGRRLMDLIDDQRVSRLDVPILKPPARDAGRHDDHVPGGCLRRGLSLAIDDAHAEWGAAEDDFGDRPDRERLAGAGAGHDAESGRSGRERPHFGPVRPIEKRVEVQAHRDLDRLARRARRRDDDDTARRRPRRSRTHDDPVGDSGR